jgi:hypothetical protein
VPRFSAHLRQSSPIRRLNLDIVLASGLDNRFDTRIRRLIFGIDTPDVGRLGCE